VSGDHPRVIMIIRHGEKPPEGDGAPHGITRDGLPDSQALVPFGWARAGALVGLFAPTVGSPRPPLVRPHKVYAARPVDGLHLRESETVSLVAAQLGVEVQMPCAVGQEDELAALLRQEDGPVLVAWEHVRIPLLVRALGATTPPAPTTWPWDRFDMVFLLESAPGGGYSFTQVPELVLPGDSADPFPLSAG